MQKKNSGLNPGSKSEKSPRSVLLVERALRVPVFGAAIFPCCSLFFKFLRAEGVLLAINFSLLMYQGKHELPHIFSSMLLSALVLAQLYGFNDVLDAANDIKDYDKRPEIAAVILENYSIFLAFSLVWAIGLLLVAHFAFPKALPGVMAMLTINMVYSMVFKGMPVVDVVVVAFWGGCFPLLLGDFRDISLLIVVGCMTGISHVWQTMRDRDADASGGIKTIAVFSQFWALIMVSLCSVSIAAIALGRLSGVLSFSAVLLCASPLLVYFTVKKIRRVWFFTKMAFAALWVMILWCR